MELNDRINFLGGRNGAGKSTTLLAIRLALGYDPKKAAVGGDGGDKFKTVIRTGTDTCVVEIDIRNEGAETLDVRKYGRTIG